MAESSEGNQGAEEKRRKANSDAGCPVFVVSDATGATAERVVRAALAQFEPEVAVIERVPNVRTVEQVKDVVRRAARQRGIIVHTLVVPELREVMLEEGRRHHVDTIDLMGPLLTRLSNRLRVSPRAQPGLFRQLDNAYIRRLEAVDFTVKHDDGRNPQTIPQADIVLVGVSRTGKTPLSIYLAYQGWRVANVPIIAGIEPPSQLFQVDPRRVVGLTVHPDRLLYLREVRLRRFPQGISGNYADYEHVREEVEYAFNIFRREGWPVVDMTNKSIEEGAGEVLGLVTKRASVAKARGA